MRTVRRRYTDVSEVFKVAQREMDKWTERSLRRIATKGKQVSTMNEYA